MNNLKACVAAAVMMTMTGTAQSALITLEHGTVLDTNTNLMWLEDWNVNGMGSWSEQVAWADSLSFAERTDWRLPSADEYLELFNAYSEQTSDGLIALSEFRNMQAYPYWSGTEVEPGSALAFRPDWGTTGPAFEGNQYFSVAVRQEDVTAVPEPQTLALALIALSAMVVVLRRRQRL